MSDTSTRPELEGIAIIGMSGRFPGAANVDEFWRNLVGGTDSISHFSEAELEYSVATPEARAAGKTFVRARGILKDAAQFDAAFFGITPREAELMDPQHRVFLECAWEALESAGHDPERFPGPIGVFAGLSLNTYLLYNLCADRRYTANFAGNFQVGEYAAMIGNDKDFLPTRVSYRLNLRGPSMAVQCACSTSLAAVSQACASLLSYQSDLALAGGVSISFPQKRDYLYTEDAMVSPDGTCRTFDAEARGTVFGHGAGVVLLRRLSDAIAEGDPVLAVITGSALNNDGAGKLSYTAPSVRGQAEVIAFAQAAAGIKPETISYIEAHGTGTPLGDPIEVAALTQAFRAGGATANGYCAIGSGKTHIGHLDAAAGVTGLIKTVLQLQHGLIPPLLHFRAPNPQIDFARSPFYPVTQLTDWKKGVAGAPRRAGVSAFGVGGTNVHVIVEEPPARTASSPARPQQLLTLSAKTPAALAVATANLAAHLSSNPGVNLADVSHTLQLGRRAFPYRRTVIAGNSTEAIARLGAADTGKISTGRVPAHEPTVVFLFPGQGSQWVGMGRELYALESVFREAVDRCCRLLEPTLGLDLRKILHPSPEERASAEKLLDETRLTQPAIFVVEYALAQLWLAWGIKPAAVLGHSIGEFAAAVIAGALPLEDAAALVATRAQLIQTLPAGSMLVVRLGADELTPLLPPGVEIAAINSPKVTTVSGPTDAITRLAADLDHRKIAAKALATSHAFHSGMMEPAVTSLAELAAKTRRQAPQIRWISSCTAREMNVADITDPSYWSRQLRQPVLFAKALTLCLEAPNTILLEVGPGQALTQLARQASPKPADLLACASLDPEQPEYASLLSALGRLWIAGASPDWAKVHAGEERHRLALPTYPFERKTYWVEPAAPPTAGEGHAVAPAPEEKLRAVPSVPSTGTAPTGDQTGTITELSAILEKLSGAPVTDHRASFLELGFDSLFLTQASQAFQTRFGVKLGFRQLLGELHNLELLAAYLSRQQPAPLPAEIPPVSDNAATANLPLTEEQREIWLAARHSPDASKAFNDVIVIRLRGDLDRTRLQEALRQLVERHDALRTTFAPDGSSQSIAPTATFDLPQLDLSGLAPAAREDRLFSIAEVEDSAPFNLETGPLLRARLIRLGSAEQVLLLAYHHIVVDGWSSGVLLRELGPLYRATQDGTAAALPAALQFRNYLALQTRPAWLSARDIAKKYWLGRYASPPPPADLPSDHPRPRTKSFLSSKRTLALPPELATRLREHCRRTQCTPFQFLFAIYTAWLHRLTGSDDLVVGVPFAGQIAEELGRQPGNRALVGHCVHFLPIRLSVRSRDGFVRHLEEVRQQLLATREHECFTYGSLVNELRLPRDPGRMPLVSVMFNLLPFAAETPAEGGLDARAAFHPKAYNIFDLNVYVVPSGDGYEINCEYNTSLFAETSIQRWQGHWIALIEAALAGTGEPLDRLPLLTADERRLLLHDWQRTEVPRDPTKCVHHHFEAQAAARPDRPALVFGSRTLTYRELDERAGRLASYLNSLGIGAESLVGICLDRSIEMVVAVLGVLKAGGAYVPIDPTYPAERVGFMLQDAAIKFLITESPHVARLSPADAALVLLDQPLPAFTAGPQPAVRPENLAYVRYTSGSTGQPKGVQIEHRAAVNFLDSMRHTPGLKPTDVLLVVTTLAFDISELEIHLPLSTGAKIILVPWETVMNGQALIETIEQHNVTVMQATPATWRLLIEAGWQGRPGLKILCGGEALPPDLAQQLLPCCVELWNMYGPTETTVWSTCERITEATEISLGRPIDNTEVYILDEQRQPVPIGVTGELLIGGAGLARGYLGRPQLTAEKFIPHPFKEGRRLYRTGDLARFHSDGRITCLGRQDFQVKIRGHRIELGEIETTLATHPRVAQAVVIAREHQGDKQLVAYYTSRNGEPAGDVDFRAHLRGRIPAYMLPALYMQLAEIPLTPNGKVDRRQLPAPVDSAASSARTEPPATAVEQQLAALWSEVLPIKTIGRQDDFFELGGNSLLAVKLFAGIEKQFSRQLPLAVLFNSPTIAGLATHLGESDGLGEQWPSLVPIRTGGTKPRFFCVHGAGGNILLYRALAARLGDDYPFYGLQSRGLDGRSAPLTTIPEMAAAYLEEIRRLQPHGPYLLGGYCMGGTIALEIATLLRQRGEEVALLALLDTYNFTQSVRIGWLRDQAQRVAFHLGSFSRLHPWQMFQYLQEKIRVGRDGEFAALFKSESENQRTVARARIKGQVSLRSIQVINDCAVTSYYPQPYPGKITLFKPKVNYAAFPDPKMGWSDIALDGLDVIALPMNPHAMLVEPFVQQLAAALASVIDRAGLTLPSATAGVRTADPRI